MNSKNTDVNLEKAASLMNGSWKHDYKVASDITGVNMCGHNEDDVGDSVEYLLEKHVEAGGVL